MKSTAPIIVFAYNRPDHLGRTLHALANNDLASESILYVYCDGAREWGGEVAPIEQEGNYITKRYGMMYCAESDYKAYLKSILDTREIAHNQKEFKELHVIERVGSKYY